MKTIASVENPLIRSIRRLQLRPGRRSDSRIIIEGMKLAREALAARVPVEQALVSLPLAESTEGQELTHGFEQSRIPWAAAGERLFRRLSGLETPEGVILVARRPVSSLDSLTGELVVVAVGIQDPGNLGAIARVAEAAGASALVVCRGSADPYQPKAMRGSMGSLLRLPVVDAGQPEEVLVRLKEKHFRIAACVARDGVDYRSAELGGLLALLLGSEGEGLPEPLVQSADLRLSVPMKGAVESLNVAVVAGLVLYESARQRGLFRS